LCLGVPGAVVAADDRVPGEAVGGVAALGLDDEVDGVAGLDLDAIDLGGDGLLRATSAASSSPVRLETTRTKTPSPLSDGRTMLPEMLTTPSRWAVQRRMEL